MSSPGLGVVGQSPPASGAGDGERVGRLVSLGGALSDPIRVQMPGMMSGGRGCCSLPDCGVPAEDQDVGICVCEFEAYFGMGQSKISYHLRKFRDAGLVVEEKRGRWSFHSLARGTGRRLIRDAADHLGLGNV